MKSFEQQFADWVHTMPADQEYDYYDGEGYRCGCAAYQFLRSVGYPVIRVGGLSWWDTSGARHFLPPSLPVAIVGYPRTFGALADRLSPRLLAAGLVED